MYKRYLISGWGAESAKLQARGEGHTLVPWGRARAAIGELPWILRHVIVPRISQSPVPIPLGALHLDSNRADGWASPHINHQLLVAALSGAPWSVAGARGAAFVKDE
jgi:hypothetical protein